MANRRSKLVLWLFLVSAFVVLALSLYTGISLNSLLDSLDQSRNERLVAEVQAASLVVSADELQSIKDEESLTSHQAIVLKRRLSAFTSLHNLEEITFIRQLPSGQLQYLISSNNGTGSYDISAAPFSSSEVIEQAFGGSLVVVEESHASDPGPSIFMAFSPVYDTSGNVIAVAAVAIDDTVIAQADSGIRSVTIILLICIVIVILAACANLLLQIRKERELEESVCVQKLMIQTSQSLVSENSYDERVAETLRILGTHLGASRACIINVSELDTQKSLEQYWSANGSFPAVDDDKLMDMRQMMREAFDEEFVSRHSESNQYSVYCTDTSQSFEKRYASLQQVGIEAFIWSPIYVLNTLWGVMALEFDKTKHEFLEKDMQLIEGTAPDLVGAVTRELFNDQRDHALDHAVHASEAKSEFLSNMSHEMRTPMNAIIGMTSIALGSSEISRKDYCLEHIKDASAHLLNIINDVLDMSSLQDGELSLKHAPFNLRQTIDGLISEYVHDIRAHNLDFSLEIDEPIPLILMGDKLRLAKVVSNLLSNAIKFTPDGGSVALRIQYLGREPEGHSLRFEIEDSGIGMDSAVQESLFGSFRQAESGTNRKYGGTGLGLAITRRLVGLMNGHLGLRSEVDKGTLFYFTVTLEEDTSEAPEPGLFDEKEAEALQADAQATASSGSKSADESPAVDSSDMPFSSGSAPADSARPDAAEAASHSKDASEDSVDDGMETPDLSGYRILLAEDIEINREVVIALLADSGIQIDTAANGILALEALSSDDISYDLVFMDLQMPKMDGLEATRSIRALSNSENANLPIIAMTANVYQEDIDACIQAGMNDHIGKPVNLEEIYRILAKYLPKRP